MKNIPCNFVYSWVETSALNFCKQKTEMRLYIYMYTFFYLWQTNLSRRNSIWKCLEFIKIGSQLFHVSIVCFQRHQSNIVELHISSDSNAVANLEALWSLMIAMNYQIDVIFDVSDYTYAQCISFILKA